jgi:predicted Zn-dependent peptidase
MPILMYRCPARSICISVGINDGVSTLPKEKLELAHLEEHIICEELLNKLYNLGYNPYYVNASVFDITLIYGEFLHEDFGRAIRIISHYLKKPKFSEEKLNIAKSIIKNELAGNVNDFVRFCSENLLQHLYPENYKITLPEEIDSYSLKDVIDHYNKTYCPNNMCISVVGNFSPENMLSKIRKVFEDFKKECAPKERVQFNSISGKKEVEIALKGLEDKVILALGFNTRPFNNDKSEYALSILSKIIEERLWENIREKKGYSYSLVAESSTFQSFGYIGMYLDVSPNDLESVEDILDKEIRKISQGKISDKEVRNIKKKLLKTEKLSMDNSSISQQLVRFYFLGNENIIFDKLRMIKEVNTQDVIEVGRKYINPNSYVKVRLSIEKS